jgi:mRNA-degrading endonuclease toxin of MazEF toxin-antitoxin module
MVDQVRAIDARRLMKPLGAVPSEILSQVLRQLFLLLEYS